MPPIGQHFLNEDNTVDTVSFFSCVMVVDGDDARRAATCAALEPLVLEVLSVKNGAEAFEALETQYLELVILSTNLADIPGLSLLEAIFHFRPALPVIISVEKSGLEDALRGLREGAWDYVVKDGDPLGEQLASSLQRVAERKLGELRDLDLRSERNAFWGAVQTARDGLAIVNPGGLVSFANPAFQDFVEFLGGGHTSDQPVNILSLIAHHDRPLAEKFGEALQANSAGEKMWTSELKVNGSCFNERCVERYFHLHLSSFQMAEGSLAVLGDQRQVLWLSDVTLRKDHEKFQRDVLSTTSHDLKGPLGTIGCAAELIVEAPDGLSSENLQLVHRIYAASRKALNHIDEFLSARRIEEGMLKIEPRVLSVADVLEDLGMDYAMMAKNKDIELHWAVSDPSLEVFADRMALVRVLENLLSNAIKFTPEGGSIRLLGAPHGDMTRLSVSDTGPGIDPQARRGLFERYTRLQQHTQVEGSGLGLFIVKSIVEAHRGRVEVESQLGAGTTFVIYFRGEERAEAVHQNGAAPVAT